jgi:hypothetical protein
VGARFDSPSNTDRFLRAAEQWALPAAATVTRQSSAALTVQLTDCDAGPSAAPAPPVEPPPFQVLALLGLFVTQHHARAAAAACAADQLIDQVGPAALASYDAGSAPAGAADQITKASNQAMTTCGINWR